MCCFVDILNSQEDTILIYLLYRGQKIQLYNMLVALPPLLSAFEGEKKQHTNLKNFGSREQSEVVGIIVFSQ